MNVTDSYNNIGTRGCARLYVGTYVALFESGLSLEKVELKKHKKQYFLNF